ncbi:MAG TPA: ABC transporter permease [Methylomirabilota bacterium]|jgi:ABC-2 type transport system permease protein|nr:ABC transporter permease [Methylomirabilota bacterium]
MTAAGRHLTKTSAFFLRSWRMTRRNTMTVFEVVFWPVVSLLSVGLMTSFLRLGEAATLFVLTGTVAFSVVQVCQLDVTYAVLFDMWAKSVKHQFLAPVYPWQMALGAWLMGVLRAVAVFALMTVVSQWAFGLSFLRPGWGAVVVFLLGLVLSAAAVGLLVSALLLLFGVHAEVTAWSGVSLMLLLCGIYYPVSLLPGPLAAVAGGIPLTYFLEAFRAEFGFPPVFPHPLARGFTLGVVYLAAAYLAFKGAIGRSRRTGMLLKLSD